MWEEEPGLNVGNLKRRAEQGTKVVSSHDVVPVDARFNMIASHVMDLEHTLPLGAGRSIRCLAV